MFFFIKKIWLTVNHPDIVISYYLRIIKGTPLLEANMSVNPNKTVISPKEKILTDYHLAVQSREISLLGRKEVFMGKAKFGIFGDGKEVAQIVFSKMFKKGDWRSGYYRDQTLMMALGLLTPEQFFAQLYAHADYTV